MIENTPPTEPQAGPSAPSSEGTAGETPPDAESSEPPASSGQPRRLYRSSQSRVVSGLSGGIGEYLNVDPVIIRLAFVALTLAGGIGLVLYGVGWLLVPEAGSGEPGWKPPSSLAEVTSRPEWVAVALVVLVAMVILNGFSVHPGILWPILLVLFGIYLLSDRDIRQRREPGVGNEGDLVAATTNPAQESPTITTANYGGAPPRVRKREHSVLGMLTIGIALLATGTAVMLDYTSTVSLTDSQLFAVPLTILGIGLLVGTWVGRARWLIFPAVALLPFVSISNVHTSAVDAGVGPRTYRPASFAEVVPNYELGAGKLVVDLSAVEFPPPGYQLQASVGVGEVVVIVPRNIPVRVDADLGVGNAEIFGQQWGGPGISISTDNSAVDRQANGPNLDLEVHGGIGHVVVSNDPNVQEAQQ